ncbi:MAG TPA: enoyl-CoA hydratase/isomerase family protein [Myxococcales bacterium]|nr:enoyl-CoA hydratase/isomerase family protein [Myxococcales bacterium]
MRIESRGSVALVTLQSGKVNAVGPDFVERMHALLDGARDARALVLTGAGNAFSAGLDLPSLIELDRPTMRGFIDRFDALMLRIFELPVPAVAAMNGHAIAGGCVLALQCDVRLAADKEARIGLNEVQLGIGLPAVVLETLRWQVPASSLAPIALEGRLFQPREALQLGLVHEVLPEAELVEKALQRAAALASMPPSGVRMVKSALRRPAADAVRKHDAAEAEKWLDGWFSSETQERLRATVAKLKK